MKKFANGIYEVRITGITYGESCIKKTPFFICRFEGSGRYYEEKVHLTENSKKYLTYLYYKAGVRSNNLDGSDLIGAELGLKIITGTSVKTTGEYVTFPKLEKLFNLKELKELKVINSALYAEEKGYYDHGDETFDETDTAEIFGVNIRDVATVFSKDPCEVSDSDIMEYCGY